MQVQGPNSSDGGSSSSSIRVQREVQISQLPRHQSYCLTGLATAGLGAYTGYLVTKIAAPAGEKVVLYLTSPAAQAAAASAAADSTAAADGVAAAGSEAKGEGAAAGVRAAEDGSSSDGQASETAAVGADGLPDRSQHSTDTAAEAEACADSSSQTATVGHRGFWLQRLTRTREILTLPAAGSTAAPAAAAEQTQQQGCGSSTDDARHPDAGAAVPKAPAPAPAPGGAKASSNRLEMFKAILQRQRQQQQQQQPEQGGLQQFDGRAPAYDEKVGLVARSKDGSLHTDNSSSAFTACTATCGTSAPLGVAASAPAATGTGGVSAQDHQRQLQEVVGSRGSRRAAQKSRLGERQLSASCTGSGIDAVAAVVVSNKRQKRGGATA